MVKYLPKPWNNYIFLRLNKDNVSCVMNEIDERLLLLQDWELMLEAVDQSNDLLSMAEKKHFLSKCAI